MPDSHIAPLFNASPAFWTCSSLPSSSLPLSSLPLSTLPSSSLPSSSLPSSAGPIIPGPDDRRIHADHPLAPAHAIDVEHQFQHALNDRIERLDALIAAGPKIQAPPGSAIAHDIALYQSAAQERALEEDRRDSQSAGMSTRQYLERRYTFDLRTRVAGLERWRWHQQQVVAANAPFAPARPAPARPAPAQPADAQPARNVRRRVARAAGAPNPEEPRQQRAAPGNAAKRARQGCPLFTTSPLFPQEQSHAGPSCSYPCPPQSGSSELAAEFASWATATSGVTDPMGVQVRFGEPHPPAGLAEGCSASASSSGPVPSRNGTINPNDLHRVPPAHVGRIPLLPLPVNTSNLPIPLPGPQMPINGFDFASSLPVVPIGQSSSFVEEPQQVVADPTAYAAEIEMPDMASFIDDFFAPLYDAVPSISPVLPPGADEVPPASTSVASVPSTTKDSFVLTTDFDFDLFFPFGLEEGSGPVVADTDDNAGGVGEQPTHAPLPALVIPEITVTAPPEDALAQVAMADAVMPGMILPPEWMDDPSLQWGGFDVDFPGMDEVTIDESLFGPRGGE